MKQPITLAIFAIIITSLSNANAQEQELYYKVEVAGQEVGKLLVTKNKINSSTTYISAVTEVEYRLFKRYHIVYLYEAIYEDGALQKAYFINRKNEAEEEESRLTFLSEKKAYRSEKEDNNTLLLSGKTPLTKSMLQMYWTPPNKRDSIFSERFHSYLQVAKIPDENRYIFQLPNGDKNIYKYNKEGICEEIELEAPVMNLKVTLTEKK